MTYPRPPYSAYMFIFYLFMILCLCNSIFTLLICPKKIILIITNNILQLFYLLGNINPFGRVNNKAITWNWYINLSHYLPRNIFQILSKNIILRYVTFDFVQRVWIDHRVLIFFGFNMNMVTDRSSSTTPIFLWPKVTHMIKDLLLHLIKIFKSLCDKWREFQHIQKIELVSQPDVPPPPLMFVL